MADKQKHQEVKQEFTFAEVDSISQLIQSIYSLDDAIANQEALKRPASFVQPLKNIRMGFNGTLTALMSKGQPQQENPDTGAGAEDPANQ
jgi:hypothetical protein